MLQRQRAAQAMIVAFILNLVISAIVPVIAFAHGDHADHADKGGIDMVTTLQGVGVLAVLGLGYLVISRQASRREDDRRDRGM